MPYLEGFLQYSIALNAFLSLSSCFVVHFFSFFSRSLHGRQPQAFRTCGGGICIAPYQSARFCHCSHRVLSTWAFVILYVTSPDAFVVHSHYREPITNASRAPVCTEQGL